MNPEDERARDDAVRPELKWIGVVILVVLMTAALLLYVFPGDAGRKTNTVFAHGFAWPVKPEMTAMFMGSCYGAGAYFFYRVSFGHKWHPVAAYFPGISVFTWLMGITTFLHWGKFNHGHVTFFAWLFLYVTTPFVVPLLYIRNRGADPGVSDRDDTVVPQAFRRLAGIGGIALLATAAIMYLTPMVAIDVAPWKLTNLTSRVVAAFLSAVATAAMLLARDPRWSAWKVFVRSAVLSAGLLLIAGVRAWDEFDSSNPLSYIFLAGTGVLFAGGITLDRVMQARSRPAVAGT